MIAKDGAKPIKKFLVDFFMAFIAKIKFFA